MSHVRRRMRPRKVRRTRVVRERDVEEVRERI